ncbi:MAG: HAMP domain-containing sensor histidine kinase [Candidatus Omnitrophota bacterium]|nr:HAMP domain-containing sensor histidine kinase [Candidatus Omnitrophota bacterium]
MPENSAQEGESLETGRAPQIIDQDLVNSLQFIKGIAESQLESFRRDQGDSEKEKLEQAEAALSKTLEQVSKVIEMIHYFKSIIAVDIRGSGRTDEASLHESVNQILRAMNYEFPFKNVTILKILPHDLPVMQVTRAHLDMILFQLIYRARQSIKSGSGIITIEAQEKTILSPENSDASRIEIRVSDTGPPIEQKEMPYLFDPFVRTRDSSAGLGLYLVKRLVDLNKGHVRVATAPTSTSFFVDFPSAA